MPTFPHQVDASRYVYIPTHLHTDNPPPPSCPVLVRRPTCPSFSRPLLSTRPHPLTHRWYLAQFFDSPAIESHDGIPHAPGDRLAPLRDGSLDPLSQLCFQVGFVASISCSLLSVWTSQPCPIKTGLLYLDAYAYPFSLSLNPPSHSVVSSSPFAFVPTSLSLFLSFKRYDLQACS